MANSVLDRFKLVCKDKNGKVEQIHECYRAHVPDMVVKSLSQHHSVTVTQLTPDGRKFWRDSKGNWHE